MSHLHRATCQSVRRPGCCAARMQASFARTVIDANNSMVVELSSSWWGLQLAQCDCGAPSMPLAFRRRRKIRRINYHGATGTNPRGCNRNLEALTAGDSTRLFSLCRYLSCSQPRSNRHQCLLQFICKASHCCLSIRTQTRRVESFSIHDIA